MTVWVTPPSDIPVRLFDRDGEVYADCPALDLMAQGENDQEALENLSGFILSYCASQWLGRDAPGENLRNKLLRIAFPKTTRDRFTTLPSPTSAAIAEQAEQIRKAIEAVRRAATP